MTIVLDCNILVICLTSRSPYHNIYKGISEWQVNACGYKRDSVGVLGND